MRTPVEVVAARPAWGRLAPPCRRLLFRLRRAVGRPQAGVAVLLAPDSAVRRLNRRHLGHDRVTDVLSFPAGEDLSGAPGHLGDIAIAVPRATRQARRARWSLGEEMALLVTHGFLHLLGHDHETDGGTMRRLEAELLRREAGVRLEQRGLPWGTPAAPAGRRIAR